MTDIRKIDDRFAVGLGHPTEDDLEQLAADGYKAVVNLRRYEEDGQPMTPDEEGETVRRLGMAYRHIPVSGDSLNESLVDTFRAHVKELVAPIYVHCASGKRSGAFTMMHLASEARMSGEQTLERAEAMGFECDNKDLANFVRSYVDRHQS